jgi:integrase
MVLPVAICPAKAFSFRSGFEDLKQDLRSVGLGKFDKKLRHYEGLKPHDFRRSASRNLIKAGVNRRIAMQITGHKIEHIFERYNIKTTDDVKGALIKVGQFKHSTVSLIAEKSSTR